MLLHVRAGRTVHVATVAGAAGRDKHCRGDLDGRPIRRHRSVRHHWAVHGGIVSDRGAKLGAGRQFDVQSHGLDDGAVRRGFFGKIYFER